MPRPEDLSEVAVHLSSMPRPGLTNHHSNSLPSTPYQYNRNLSFSSRSPSPKRVEGERSPRSARSDSETGLTSGGQGSVQAGCIYETGMAYSRRRVPYSIGGDQLEGAKTPPPKYLNPSEEKKLSEDMGNLYHRILPSKESDERRAKFKQKLEHILNEQWPGNDIKVHVFGSSGNMLCSNDSDVDICITTPMKALERVCLLAKALADHGMKRVVCVPHAKVPIVKIWDSELELACDMNVNNTLALENTRMIKTYVEIDERVRPLAMVIKHWTKRRILNDAALGGTLSSYTWICMILNFLQTRNPPVLPCLHRRPHQRSIDANGKPSAFADDMDALRGFGMGNKETLGELLFHFFRRYAHEIDYEKNVISVREGRLISKEAKKWHLMQNNRLCVEEPFNTDRNLGNTADDISFRGVHLELRRAFDLVSEARLGECMEQYEFPLLEEKVWEKPVPKPMPILSRSRSQSQSGRGGKLGFVNRGNKNFSGQHRAGQARRASSAAATNKPVASQVSGRGLPNHEQHVQAHFQQLHLHDHLFNEYQFLQAQEQELRAIQAQAQAQLQARAQASAQVQAPGSTAPLSQHGFNESLNRSATINPASFSAPLQSGAFPYQIAYHPVPGTPHQNIHTNPSSPARKAVHPELRRSTHRSSNADDDSSPTLRSHSQPARPQPFALTMHNLQGLPIDANSVLQYNQLRHQQQILNYTLEPNRGHQRHPDQFRRRQMQSESVFEENLPKEYIGYYVHDSPPSRPYRDDPTIARVPTYHDLSHQYKMLHTGFGRLMNPSRSPSPSPSIPLRDRSFSMRSAASAPPGPVRQDRNASSKSGYWSSGPIIVDGSGGLGLHECHPAASPSSLAASRSEVTPPLDANGHDVPSAAGGTPYYDHGRRSSFGREGTQAHQRAHLTSDPSRMGQSGRNGMTEPLQRRTSTQASDQIPTVPGNKRSDYVTNGHGLGIDFEILPKRQSTDPPRRFSHGSEPLTESSPTVNAKSDARSDKQLKPVPLLSPVREVRTPSPTLSRKDELFMDGQYTSKFRNPLQLDIPPFGGLLNGKQKNPDWIPSRSEGKLFQPVESPNVGQPPQSNGWQQSSKKGRKNKPKGPTHQSTVSLPGEVLPLDEAERKGG